MTRSAGYPDRIGILGGTFDPIHLGHLAVAEAACAALGLSRVLFIPSHHPPHRRLDPLASGYHRFAMVALSLQDRRQFVASDVELLTDSRSYTSTTLGRLQQEGCEASQLFFITGADAFAEIATWKDYPTILDLAHFVVISRPGQPVADLPDRLETLRDRMVMTRAAGAGTEAVQRPGTTIWLVPADTPDVSSTEIRRRAHAGQTLEGLVSPPVADYIERHHLYR